MKQTRFSRLTHPFSSIECHGWDNIYHSLGAQTFAQEGVGGATLSSIHKLNAENQNTSLKVLRQSSTNSSEFLCYRCITGAKNFDSATTDRKAPHRLPVRSRSEFKVLRIAHRIVHDPTSIPAYMSRSFSMTKLARTTWL